MALLARFIFSFCCVKEVDNFSLMSVTLRNERKRGLAGMQIKGTRHQWSGPEAKAGMRLNDRCLNGCCGGPFEVSGEGKRGKQGDEGLGKENGGWERLNKQLVRSKLQAVRDSMTAAREGRSCCV